MAEAGFEPGAAVSFWKKMDALDQEKQKATGGKKEAEFSSTHPHVYYPILAGTEAADRSWQQVSKETISGHL